MKPVREIIVIDEDKCDGCGLCVPSCEEGAIQIVDGKARLVSEVFCDGLGDCLGTCPKDALTVVMREAAAFDPAAVDRYLAGTGSGNGPERRATHASGPRMMHGCPGAAARSFDAAASPCATMGQPGPSQLTHWPVQLHLVPAHAPYLAGADLLVSADCVPFAFPDFHARLLAGHVLLVGCPKLDDAEFYVEKMTQMIAANDLHSINIAYMEVPCCFGLVQIVKLARDAAGRDVPITLTKIGTQGEIADVDML